MPFTNFKRLFFFGCSEANSTWLITSKLHVANQCARKVLFTCVVYTDTCYVRLVKMQKHVELQLTNLKETMKAVMNDVFLVFITVTANEDECSLS